MHAQNINEKFQKIVNIYNIIYILYIIVKKKI